MQEFIGYDKYPNSKLWKDSINRYATDFIPTNVVSAVIEQESGWNLKADSKQPDGDYGLGQFTNYTRKNYPQFANQKTDSADLQIKYIYQFLQIKHEEMKTKDIWETVRRYNGDGPKSYVYMNSVKAKSDYILENAYADKKAPTQKGITEVKSTKKLNGIVVLIGIMAILFLVDREV